jgi:hypothetical protein
MEEAFSSIAQYVVTVYYVLRKINVKRCHMACFSHNQDTAMQALATFKRPQIQPYG